MEQKFSKSSTSALNQDMYKQADFEDVDNGDKYQVSLIVSAVSGILFYYIGCFLIVFLRSDLNGALVSAAPNYEISWKLAFENFPQLLINIYDAFFGYFSAYGELYNRSTVFLIPVDIGVKLFTICYFMWYWIPWDTKRAYKLGYFNSEYPYVSDEFKEDIDYSRIQEKSVKIEQKEISEVKPEFVEEKVVENIDHKSVSLYPQYNLNSYLKSQQHLNPYVRAQQLKNSKPVQQYQAATPSAASIYIDNSLDNYEDDEDNGILPFAGVHKPLEELYQTYEKYIYDLIRTKILPGSNILLVGYFSTLFIVDLANPISMVLYVLGVMSMFWCMQSFLLVIDYLQFNSDNQ